MKQFNREQLIMMYYMADQQMKSYANHMEHRLLRDEFEDAKKCAEIRDTTHRIRTEINSVFNERFGEYVTNEHFYEVGLLKR